MIVPGSNLLRLALSVQGTQTLRWHQATGRTTNSVGKDVTAYADPVDVKGSFQPMSRASVMRNGLNIEKNYGTLYCVEPIQTAGRDLSGDQFSYGGSRWQAAGEIDWTMQDSWDAVTLVRIGPDA